MASPHTSAVIMGSQWPVLAPGPSLWMGVRKGSCRAQAGRGLRKPCVERAHKRTSTQAHKHTASALCLTLKHAHEKLITAA